jgi:RNA polymerase sigma-B factor
LSATALLDPAPAGHDVRQPSTEALFRRLRRSGDSGAQDALVARFLPLARKLARRYYGGGEPLEDLVQVASLGLLKAVQRYDHTRGTSFSSYAVPTITGELKRYFRDHSWDLHVPRGMRERALAVKQAIRDVSGRTGRTPTTRELAEYLELDDREVLDAQSAYQAFDTASLDAPLAGQDDGEQESRLETIGSVDEDFALADTRMTLDHAMEKLPHQERRVLHMRYVEDRTQSDIATRIGVSQMQVSRILRRTVQRLQRSVEPSVTPAGALSV